MTTKAASQIASAAPPEDAIPLDCVHDAMGRIARLQRGVEALRAEFDDCVTRQRWPGYAGKLTATVCDAMQALQSENDELEGILAGVTSQLTRLEAWSASSTADITDQRLSAIDLEQGVRDHVASLQSDVAESADLQALKRQIKDRLDFVTDRLADFRIAEERRLGEIERRNEALQRELAELQRRSVRLRAEFDAQKALLMHDALTGVLSRHAYEIRLKEEFARWERHGTVFAYTFWDVDDFKAVNDTHGHRSGDRLLKQIATVLDRYTRTTDIVARVGGEEFVILMPATGADEAKVVADKLRQLIARSRFEGFAERKRFNVSCGISAVRIGDTSADLLARADAALHRAKNAGKNCCVVG